MTFRSGSSLSIRNSWYESPPWKPCISVFLFIEDYSLYFGQRQRTLTNFTWLHFTWLHPDETFSPNNLLYELMFWTMSWLGRGGKTNHAETEFGFTAVKRKKQRHFWSCRAMKLESVQMFTSAKFLWKRYIKCPKKPNFAPIKLVDASYFILNTCSK